MNSRGPTSSIYEFEDIVIPIQVKIGFSFSEDFKDIFVVVRILLESE